MNEFEKLYTVEDIARMTNFTSRTIRNYIKDGSLQGSKIGGQWRFTMENIKQLFSNGTFLGDFSRRVKQQIFNFIRGKNTDDKNKIQVCSIIDCYCESPEAAHGIYEKLVAVINSREKGTYPVKFDFEFMKKENTARFTLFGEPEFVIKNLQLLK